MNYIGSKLSLLPEIRGMLVEQGLQGTFCDLFSGSTIVAQMAKEMGFRVITNDLQTYSLVFQRAFIENNGYPSFHRLLKAIPEIKRREIKVEGRTLWVDGAPQKLQTFGWGQTPDFETGHALLKVLAFLDRLPPQEGRFFHAYCEGGEAGRSYFSRENGQRCEAIRGTLEHWLSKGWINGREHAILLASLIESMDQVANTASIYGAFLKRLKTSARTPLSLRFPLLQDGDKSHRILQGDANRVIRDLAKGGWLDVLYLDPPYNRRQYHANYHILETLARWDLERFEPSGKTGLRPADQRSSFCLKREATRAFEDLIERAKFRHILVSYNNEGLIPEEELIGILEKKAKGGKTVFRKIPYRRFRADADSENRNYRGNEVEEFLFYVEVNG
ncbi:MAG: DNA adenine methylase [Bacteroidota bacterium]